ncbi:carboxypeptidase-like regulatory domain-containing protein [Haliscomenobacter sp.]|uniref:carboxypeptidase-like regulatory domain-containing protein n=1 Tax=Haliscomenobacter sp. TaxID=2717303 RepID=UPI003BA9BE49
MKTKHHSFLLFILLICWFTPESAQAQNQVLQGRIVDEKTNEPLPFASVYYNNSTMGSQSDVNGYFSLPFLGLNVELVVSYVGYETLKYPITQALDDRTLLFKLSPIVKNIKEFAISAPRSETWYKNLDMFISHVIGGSHFAEDCEILNPEVLQFFYDTTTLVMSARASDLLKIENKAFGYMITYALIEYRYNVLNREFIISGYPYFTPMIGTRAKHIRWDRNRRMAYEGSLLHFIRTLHQDSLARAVFEVRSVKRLPDTTYQDEEKIITARNALKRMPYYQAVNKNSPHQRLLMRAERDQYIEKIEPALLPLKAYTSPSSSKLSLRFKDYLMVSFEKAHPYRAEQKVTVNTYVQLLEPEAKLDHIGLILEPGHVHFEGYWASQLLGDMLPFDYVPFIP